MQIDRVKTIRPGDMCVLECDRELSMEDAGRLRMEWEERMPGTTAVVLDGSIRLSRVLSRRHRKLGRMPAR